MSLINEALKKARLEAAQRDARQRGVLVPKAAAYGPRRRTGRIAAAAVAGALALGLAAAGGMWLARRDLPVEPGGAATAPAAASAETGGPTPAGAAEGAVATRGGSESAPAAVADRAAPSPPTTSAPEAFDRTPETDPGPAPAADGPAEAGPPAGIEPTAAPAPSSPVVAKTPMVEAPQRPPEPAPARPVSTRPARTAPRAEPGYVREAPLPGGGTLRLDGIAWSETAPTAVIDGQIVGPGERIRGALVARIERDRVVLEADGSEIVVRLR